MIWLLLFVLALVLAGVGIGLGVARRRGGDVKRSVVHIDPFTIGEPWRRHVSSAQSTARRYAGIVAAVPAGPLRDRLTEIGRQVQHGVEECWQIAKRGDEVDAALKRINTTSLQSRLAGADDDTKTSLQTQLDAGLRIRATRDDADQRLRTLNTRLDELVAQAAEVSLGTDMTAELGTGVDDVITQLEALRLAIDDVNAVAGGAPPVSAVRPPAAAGMPTDAGITSPAADGGASATGSVPVSSHGINGSTAAAATPDTGETGAGTTSPAT